MCVPKKNIYSSAQMFHKETERSQITFNCKKETLKEAATVLWIHITSQPGRKILSNSFTMSPKPGNKKKIKNGIKCFQPILQDEHPLYLFYMKCKKWFCLFWTIPHPSSAMICFKIICVFLRLQTNKQTSLRLGHNNKHLRIDIK